MTAGTCSSGTSASGAIQHRQIPGEDRLNWLLPGAHNIVMELHDAAAAGQSKLKHARQVVGVGLRPKQDSHTADAQADADGRRSWITSLTTLHNAR